jgi:hypothetical protein
LRENLEVKSKGVKSGFEAEKDGLKKKHPWD